MLHRLPISLVGLSFTWVVLVGCGGSSDEGNDEVDTTGDTAGDTTGTTGDTTGDGDTTTSDTTGDTTGDTTSDTTSDTTGDTTDTTETGMGQCQVWAITYELTDSEFEISGTPLGAGDQVNIVTEPYADDDHIGPGTFVLHFQDVAGEPGGQAFIHSYDMDINFVISGVTTVTTDLVATAGPAECGLTSGPLSGTTVDWAPAEIADVHTMGTILCMGNLCGLGGLPNGMAVPVDDTAPQPTNPFDFSADLTTFSMDQIVIQMDDQSTTSWTYAGTEVSRELIDAPACLCE